MSHPVETLTVRTGIVAAANDNELVGAPGANKRIVVVSFSFQNESQTATVGIMRSGATINGWRHLCQYLGDFKSKTFPLDREWRLNWNQPLNLWLANAVQFGYSVEYFTEGRNA